MFQQHLTNSTSSGRLRTPRTLRSVFGIAVAAATAFAFCAAAHAQPSPTYADQMTLASGTVIPVTLDTELSTSKNTMGDTFTVSIDTGKEAYGDLMPGGTIKGMVRAATPMGAGNPGMLELSFISLRMPDGTVYPLSGSVMDMNAGEFNISRKGILEAKNPSLDSRLTYVGIGLGSSALVAPPNGEKLSIGELSRVGIQDYSTDLALRNPDRVHEVVLASGTTLGVILTDPLTLSAREMPDSTTTMSRGAALRDATRYYQYDGRSWAVDLATGDRHPVSSGIMHAATGKYYSYHGHAYYMDSGTGARSQLD